MELDEKYLTLLLEILTVRDQCIPENHGLNKEKRELLDHLIDLDLVEYENGAFYLTYEGYEMAEEFQRLNETGAEMANLEFEHLRNKEKGKALRWILSLLFILLVLSVVINGIRVGNLFEHKEPFIEEEIINEIQKEIEMKIDSIREQQGQPEINDE